MSDKQENKSFIKSADAIKLYSEYVEKKGGSSYNHKARVLISRGTQTYNKILEVGIIFSNVCSKITICGDNEFCKDFYGEYTCDKNIFKYYSPGMLIIEKTEDIWGNHIEIDMSYYREGE
ncbi:MAG: hypothetical protein IJW37_01345 [Lachnospiraceae bacterium]|nr:hypothetical protein [Lachnospiraceae bacterium]